MPHTCAKILVTFQDLPNKWPPHVLTSRESALRLSSEMEELRATMRQVQAKSWCCCMCFAFDRSRNSQGPSRVFSFRIFRGWFSRRTANAVAMRLANARRKLPWSWVKWQPCHLDAMFQHTFWNTPAPLNYPPKKLTWQWNTHPPFEDVFPIEHGDFPRSC